MKQDNDAYIYNFSVRYKISKRDGRFYIDFNNIDHVIVRVNRVQIIKNSNTANTNAVTADKVRLGKEIHVRYINGRLEQVFD